MKTKKQWKTPHTFVILACIMIPATIATYFVPAGEFERYQNAAGETLVLAGSYHQVEAHPESFLALPGTVYRGITDAASTVTFILMIGGAFEIITSTGAIAALCHKLSRMFVNRKYLVIPVFLILFSIFGFTMGMSAEVMIFVPSGIALALSLGFTARLWYDIEAHPVTYSGPVECLDLPEDFDEEAFARASYRYDLEQGMILPLS